MIDGMVYIYLVNGGGKKVIDNTEEQSNQVMD